MKVPGLDLPRFRMGKLGVPRLGLAGFRRRIFFRAVFALLVLATLGLALTVLRHEKERSYLNYQNSFRKTQSEILARLRHPAGQLALLNPQHAPAAPGQGAELRAGLATVGLRLAGPEQLRKQEILRNARQLIARSDTGGIVGIGLGIPGIDPGCGKQAADVGCEPRAGSQLHAFTARAGRSTCR